MECGDENVENHDGADTAVRRVVERLVRGPLVDLSLVTHEETDTRDYLRDHGQNQRNRQDNQLKSTKKTSSGKRLNPSPISSVGMSSTTA